MLSIIPVTSGPYTASPYSGIVRYSIYNSSGAGFTFNLPAFPALNQEITISDASLTGASHSITINGNGSPIHAGGISGIGTSINSAGGTLTLAWDGTLWFQI